jgi:hypothetical protein
MVSQVEALRRTVKTLGLGPEYAALVAAAEGVASALDEYPARATLWAEYRPLLLDLLRAGKAEGEPLGSVRSWSSGQPTTPSSPRPPRRKHA